MGISTHVLNTAAGRPAAGVGVTLDRVDNEHGTWESLRAERTDADGRVAPLLSDDELAAGRYRITFASGEYFSARGETAFHPHVAIEFDIASPSEHYHVPLLVTPWSYSTYRGS